MLPFVRELAWQLAQAYDDYYSNKNQNREHNKCECVQRTK